MSTVIMSEERETAGGTRAAGWAELLFPKAAAQSAKEKGSVIPVNMWVGAEAIFISEAVDIDRWVTESLKPGREN